ncbi:MAG: 3-hydroxyacyl-ACP dehydratase FabZ [Gammaproteobacteria bacterium]|jgi:3-hydroxyacyl-[acyl-carrier-protein] dehydratase|tara:strand:+ start:57 stop:497 length:441 start_codon:yes stop_codon:yes gene_type:complete
MSYEFSDILNLLPHRHPFLFIDKIVSVELGQTIHAQKNVTINEDFFNGHFPNKPVMPGVLIIEALGQAAGILGFLTMGKTPDKGSIYYLVGVDKVRFKNPVSPGETIDLYATISSEKRGIWKFDCKAEADGKNVCEATILCADRPK